MTMTNNNNEQATTTPEHTYEVLTGHRYIIKASEKFEALREAVNKFKEQHGESEGTNISETVFTEVIEVNRQAVTMPIPEGVSYIEARNLLEWALETADRSRVDWSNIREQLDDPESTQYEAVRDELDGMSPELFVTWAGQLSGFSYAYQVTSEELAKLARDCVDSYLGEYRDRAEFAREYYEDSGEVTSTPPEVLDAVDWEQVWDYALAYDTDVITLSWSDHFFRNH